MTKFLFTLIFVCSCLTVSGQTSDLQLSDAVFATSEQISIAAEVGRLQVPEKRSNENSRFININFIRLKSLSKNPLPPLVYLVGGDAPCTWQASNPESLDQWLPYLSVSDVILVDQRGTTDENLQWIWFDGYPENFLVSEQEAGDHWKTMASRALPAFKEKGIDVTGYTFHESARDIECLMSALKIDRFSILGFSSGSTLGLTLVRLCGDKIENAVLAGADSPEHTFNLPSFLDKHFQKIAAMSNADPEISRVIPDLNYLLELVIQKLEKKPMEVEVKNPLTGQDMTVKVGPFGLNLILRLDIDDATDIPVIPRLLYSIDQGDPGILQWFVQKRVVYAFAIPGNGLNKGINSATSAERFNKIDKESIESRFGNIVNFPFYDIRDVWPLTPPARNHYKIVENKVRVLFLSGSLDSRTPPTQAELYKKEFHNATHLVVENAGHEQILTNPQITTAIVDFLSGKEVESVNASYGPIRFIPLSGMNKERYHPSLN